MPIGRLTPTITLFIGLDCLWRGNLRGGRSIANHRPTDRFKPVALRTIPAHVC